MTEGTGWPDGSGDGWATHRELEMALQMCEQRLARMETQLDAIDASGTRAMGSFSERLREITEQTAAHLQEHRRQQEQAVVLRRELHRWRFTAAVSIISLAVSVLALVLHFLNVL